MVRILFRIFRRMRRCVLYQSCNISCVYGLGGRHRFHVSALMDLSGWCANVGSSQCFSGDPRICWALLHDFSRYGCRYVGWVRVYLCLGVVFLVLFVMFANSAASKFCLMLFLISVTCASYNCSACGNVTRMDENFF